MEWGPSKQVHPTTNIKEIIGPIIGFQIFFWQSKWLNVIFMQKMGPTTCVKQLVFKGQLIYYYHMSFKKLSCVGEEKDTNISL